MRKGIQLSKRVSHYLLLAMVLETRNLNVFSPAVLELYFAKHS